MDALNRAIDSTPIIDNHAHNLLLPDELEARDFIAITTEAGGSALNATPSTLSHIRAVRQLSQILGCDATWKAVQAAVAKRRQEPKEAWARYCFEGLETVLIDDGLDESTVRSWEWHNQLTRSPCKRIVRIEKVAETILASIVKARTTTSNCGEVFIEWEDKFVNEIGKTINDPNVVGFKSVICYRTGLDIPGLIPDKASEVLPAARRMLPSAFSRLEDEVLSPYFVHLTSQMIVKSGTAKPLQFHTGLGDNDITLLRSNPSHMQNFIKAYPKLPIVILHSSYPFTREAGYLASVYDNVYLDIGEVFPMVSQDGQESIIRQSLELCPSEKLCWSTDGHWFPETYLLAVLQIREGLKEVLQASVRKQTLTVPQAIKVVEDILFNTSNSLYNLKLDLHPLSSSTHADNPIATFNYFLAKNPSIKYLRIQWVDYTGTPRARILPVNRAITLFSEKKGLSITKATLGLLQTDSMIPSFLPVGDYYLTPCFESLRLGERNGYATVQCEFWEKDGSEVDICPRSALRRVVQRAAKAGINFLIGFELEVVFLQPVTDPTTKKTTYEALANDPGHAWSVTSALRNPDTMDMIEEIASALATSEIELQQWHAENAPGQYEIITGPLPALAAVDTLVATREIIFAVAAKHNLKATFIPKPYPMACGTGAHVHISMTPEDKYESFYAGILENLRSIVAFTYSGKESYDRVVDGAWAGGKYVTWGIENKETPLRKVEGSHWEIKCLDGLANPYLATAALLGPGLRGVEQRTKLTWKNCAADPALLNEEEKLELGIQQMLPASIEEALEQLKADGGLTGLDNEQVAKTYFDVKVAELEMLGNMEQEERRTFMIEHY